jgi:hypothetical protein
MNLISKWKEIITKMNSSGIPAPTVRDPKTGLGSVTCTLVVVSAGLCTGSILLMLGTCLAKISNDFVLNPETAAQIHDAFVSSLQFLIASLGAYLGRKMQRDANGAISMEKSDKES